MQFFLARNDTARKPCVMRLWDYPLTDGLESLALRRVGLSRKSRMFPNYRFVEPHTEKSVRIGKLSYLWASLLGPLYLLVKAGPRKLLQSLALSIACAVALFVFVARGLSYIPGDLQPVALLLAVIAFFLVHSIRTVTLVKNSFIQRQWAPRPPN